MDDNLTDQQQAELIKNWLKENSKFLIGVLLLGVSGFFGIQFFGVHLNGYIKKKNKYFMWIGKRSKKGNFPNNYDQIAAGGLPYNISKKWELYNFLEASV